MRHHIRWFNLLIALFPLTCLNGCDKPSSPAVRDQRLTDQELMNRHAPQAQNNILYFGFDLRTTPQEDARQYLPLLKYLQTATGYRFELKFTAATESIANELAAGKLHFAAMGAVSYLKAAQRDHVLPLVRGRNTENKGEYRSCIIVRPDSPLRRVGDLRGQRMAFGSLTSTQGHLIPRIILDQHGLRLTDLRTHIFTGSHQNCAEAVVTDRADACGMQDILADRLARQGTVRILFRSEYYPSSGIFANTEVAPEIINRVRKALLEFEPLGRDAAGLYAWDRTEMPHGFLQAQPDDYRALDTALRRLRL